MAQAATTGACAASWSSSQRLTGVPQRKPPRPPSEPSTRWQGTNSAVALRAHALAAALFVPCHRVLGSDGDVVDGGDVAGEEGGHLVEDVEVLGRLDPGRPQRPVDDRQQGGDVVGPAAGEHDLPAR